MVLTKAVKKELKIFGLEPNSMLDESDVKVTHGRLIDTSRTMTNCNLMLSRYKKNFYSLFS